MPPVKLETLYYIKGGIHTLRLFNCNDTILSYLIHCLGNQITDCLIIIGRYCPDLRYLFFILCRIGELFYLFYYHINCLFNPPLYLHGVCTCGNTLHTLSVYSLCKDCSSCSS